MQFIQGENPIKSVDGVSIRAPDAEDGYMWEIEDVSKDGGRTEDVTMHKNRIGQARALTLKWSGLSLAEGSAILKAFNPEYVDVTYLDPMEGELVTKTFYTGNRRSTLYSAALGKWKEISFKITTQKGR